MQKKTKMNLLAPQNSLSSKSNNVELIVMSFHELVPRRIYTSMTKNIKSKKSFFIVLKKTILTTIPY